MIRLHDFARSGHCHRVRLMLSLLGLPVELLPVDMAARAHKQPAYLALNPFGQVPVLEDGEVVVPDSTAALVWLALRYDPARRWLPADPVGAARVQRWLAVASNELVRGPVVARWVAQFGGRADVDDARRRAEHLFALLEQHLADRDWLAADHPTIADVALISYLEVADEGGLDLGPYAAIGAWMKRVAALPGYLPMTRRA